MLQLIFTEFNRGIQGALGFRKPVRQKDPGPAGYWITELDWVTRRRGKKLTQDDSQNDR